jgi:hypothetical protein
MEASRPSHGVRFFLRTLRTKKTREQMLNVPESVALYRGSAKTQDKRYPAQVQHELQPATREKSRQRLSHIQY